MWGECFCKSSPGCQRVRNKKTVCCVPGGTGHWLRPQRYGPLDADLHAAIDPMSYRHLYAPVLWRRILGERTMNQSPLPRVPL